MTDAKPRRRRFYPLLYSLLPLLIFLLFAAGLRWTNEHKHWLALIPVAVVGVVILQMLLSIAAALIFRRHYQFRIRTLLVLTAAAAVAFSWLAVERTQAAKQQAVVEAIVKLGGSVTYDGLTMTGEMPGPAWLQKLLGTDFFMAVGGVRLDKTKVADADLENLKELSQLHWLYLDDTNITDAGLAHLGGLTKLQALTLSRTRITDAGLTSLKGLTRLYSLMLIGTEVTDAGLEHLTGLTQLGSLMLQDTKVTDAGLARLEGLPQLQWLGLGGTGVTDAGLERLRGLAQLQSLFLSGTKVTAAGVKKLQLALPKCNICRGAMAGG